MWVTTHSKCEWQHTQEKGKHYNSKEYFQEDHEGSSWENREKQDWAWTKI
jgi:hypothetical protein